jgi:hypothetical protein
MKKESVLGKINLFNLFVFSLLLVITCFEIGLFTKEISSIDFLKRKIEEISHENEKLEAQVWELNHISNIEQFLEKFGFAKAEKIKFIQAVGGEVVVK